MVKVDVTKYQNMWSAMNLEAVPTLYSFKDGKYQDQVQGLQTLDAYVSFFNTSKQ